MPVRESPLRTSFCDLDRAVTTHQQLYDKGGYPILRCGRCGLVKAILDEDHQKDPWSEARSHPIEKIYDESFFEGGRTDGYAGYRASRPVILRQARRILRLLERYQSGGRLLEIGCAYGFFLEEAARRYDVLGLDVSAHAVAQATARGLNARVGSVTALDLPPASFDAVVCLETIEHLRSPYATLWHAARAARPGAVLVVNTGDIESLLGRLCGRFWRHMVPPLHLHFFSRRTLAELARRTGWRPVRINYPWRDIPLTLAVFQLLSRAFGWRRIPIPASLGIPMNLYDVMTMVAVRT